MTILREQVPVKVIFVCAVFLEVRQRQIDYVASIIRIFAAIQQTEHSFSADLSLQLCLWHTLLRVFRRIQHSLHVNCLYRLTSRFIYVSPCALGNLQKCLKHICSILRIFYELLFFTQHKLGLQKCQLPLVFVHLVHNLIPKVCVPVTITYENRVPFKREFVLFIDHLSAGLLQDTMRFNWFLLLFVVQKTLIRVVPLIRVIRIEACVGSS